MKYEPPQKFMRIGTIDMHTGGEPLRILLEGVPEIKGNTILEKRRYFRDHLDYIRTGCMFEPRGHADMYGAVIVAPERPDSDFGTFFMHNEGYSTMCGHATIALSKFAVETGMVNTANGVAHMKIDAPPGQLRAEAKVDDDGIVRRSSFWNVPSFVLYQNEKVEVPGLGRIIFDVAYGGAFYAFVEAGPLGLQLDEKQYHKLIDAGRRIKKAVMENFEINHPFEEDLSFLYGIIFTGKPINPEHHSRNVCIFADGEVDRSATGSGVSARAALLYAGGKMQPGDVFTIESVLGTTMEVEISELTNYGPYKAVVPKVSGSAWFTGKNEFWFDPEDPLKKGFIFR